MNPYQLYVAALARLISGGKALPLGGIPAFGKAAPAANAPVALLFSPHPDDECIIGGLALRLMREAGLRVVNVAVTLGSNRARQAARWQELKNACDWIGFELEATAPTGLERVNSRTREADPDGWEEAVKVIAASLTRHQPRAIFFPHELDWNSTHEGTHGLVMDALRAMPPAFETMLVETEFWGAMAAPNLLVESSEADVADLMAALSFHVGEVQRNPYHLRLLAWMMDNVRRGAERVGGQGGAAPDYAFATLYRVRQWKSGRVCEVWSGGRQIGAGESPASIFGPHA
jgi:N-acetylglucosamine malate deacetylase 1